ILYRPSTATWYINPSSGGTQSFSYGAPNVDIPALADFNGDGRSEVAVFRPTTGEGIISSSTQPPPVFGGLGHIPVPGGSSGTGKATLAVYRPSTGEFFISGMATSIPLGQPGDIPVPGFYDNTVTSHNEEAAVYRPSTGQWIIAGHAQPLVINL